MKFRATIRAAAIGSAAAIALAACGGSDAGTAAPSSAPALSPVTAAPAEGAAFVPLADGTEFDFNSLQGQDVLLWFWAPW